MLQMLSGASAELAAGMGEQGDHVSALALHLNPLPAIRKGRTA